MILDLTVRGRRLYVSWERPAPIEPEPSALDATTAEIPSMHVQSHGGAFEPNGSDYYDEHAIALGFQPRRKGSI